jgi:hypothetical protein
VLATVSFALDVGIDSGPRVSSTIITTLKSVAFGGATTARRKDFLAICGGKLQGLAQNCEDSHIPCILLQETWVCSECDWRFPGKPTDSSKKSDHMKRCKRKCRRCKEENLPCRSRTMGTTMYLCCIFCRDAEAPCSWDDTGAEEED